MSESKYTPKLVRKNQKNSQARKAEKGSRERLESKKNSKQRNETKNACVRRDEEERRYPCTAGDRILEADNKLQIIK